jgi:beta-glucuronidase
LARAAEPASPSDHAELSFENGSTLTVPGDWNSQHPRLVFYRGVVRYERKFEANPASGERQLRAGLRHWISAG